MNTLFSTRSDKKNVWSFWILANTHGLNNMEKRYSFIPRPLILPLFSVSGWCQQIPCHWPHNKQACRHFYVPSTYIHQIRQDEQSLFIHILLKLHANATWTLSFMYKSFLLKILLRLTWLLDTHADNAQDVIISSWNDTPIKNSYYICPAGIGTTI